MGGGFEIDLGGGGGGGGGGGSSSGGGSGSSSSGSSSSGGSSSSSGSSGGSSSGGSSAPADPFTVDPVKRQKLSMFQSVYTSLWGEPATEDYLKAAVNAGFNQHEFEMRERRKPAFVKTEAFRDQASSLAEIALQVG
jgi:hypothetical protein